MHIFDIAYYLPDLTLLTDKAIIKYNAYYYIIKNKYIGTVRIRYLISQLQESDDYILKYLNNVIHRDMSAEDVMEQLGIMIYFIPEEHVIGKKSVLWSLNYYLMK